MDCSLTVDSRQHFKDSPFKLLDCPSNCMPMLSFSYNMSLICVIFAVLMYPSVSSFFLNVFVAQFVSYNLASLTFVFTLSYPNSEMNFVFEDREIYFELFQIWCFLPSALTKKGRITIHISGWQRRLGKRMHLINYAHLKYTFTFELHSHPFLYPLERASSFCSVVNFIFVWMSKAGQVNCTLKNIFLSKECRGVLGASGGMRSRAVQWSSQVGDDEFCLRLPIPLLLAKHLVFAWVPLI